MNLKTWKASFQPSHLFQEIINMRYVDDFHDNDDRLHIQWPVGWAIVILYLGNFITSVEIIEI